MENSKISSVYALQCSSSKNLLKVGYGQNPWRRATEYAKYHDLPERWEVVYRLTGITEAQAKEIEKQVHSELSSVRLGRKEIFRTDLYSVARFVEAAARKNGIPIPSATEGSGIILKASELVRRRFQNRGTWILSRRKWRRFVNSVSSESENLARLVKFGEMPYTVAAFHLSEVVIYRQFRKVSGSYYPEEVRPIRDLLLLRC